MVEEPQNIVPLHAPTVPEEDAAFVPPSMTLRKLLIVLLLSEGQRFQNSITMAVLLCGWKTTMGREGVSEGWSENGILVG